MFQRIKHLVGLWKQNRTRFWRETRVWFLWFIGSPFRLMRPVQCRTIKATKHSLIGHSFYFFHLQSYKIRSPLAGYIAKIYDDNTTLHIIGANGLQVILTVNFRLSKLTSIYETVIRRVKEKQKVEKGSIIFLVVHQRQISSIAVMIPWQPLLLGKVNKLPRWGKDFASLYYRNPWSAKLKIKRFGQYSY
jgi:hypothetical protein